jgi:K+-sensing histidine kinase KdpD
VLLAIIGLSLVTLVLTSSGSNFHAATALSSYLLLMVAAIGGAWPGLPATATGFLLSNYQFVPPVHTFTRSHVHPSTIADDSDCDVLALPMVLATGGVVNVLMDLAVRRAATAAQVAGRLVSADRDPLPGNSTN